MFENDQERPIERFFKRNAGWITPIIALPAIAAWGSVVAHARELGIARYFQIPTDLIQLNSYSMLRAGVTLGLFVLVAIPLRGVVQAGSPSPFRVIGLTQMIFIGYFVVALSALLNPFSLRASIAVGIVFGTLLAITNSSQSRSRLLHLFTLLVVISAGAVAWKLLGAWSPLAISYLWSAAITIALLRSLCCVERVNVYLERTRRWLRRDYASFRSWVLIAAASIPISFGVGYSLAKHRTDFYSVESHPDFLLVAIYGDRYLLREVIHNGKAVRFGPQLKILTDDDVAQTTLTLQEIVRAE